MKKCLDSLGNFVAAIANIHVISYFDWDAKYHRSQSILEHNRYELG